MTMINKQELLKWLCEEQRDATRQWTVLRPGDRDWHEYRGRSAAFSYVIHYVNSMPDAEPLPETPRFKVGDRVRATDGVFEGIQGTVTFVHPSIPRYTWIEYDNGVEVSEFVGDEIELLPAEPAPSAKDIKVTFKLTGAEAFIESAKQLIEALEALEVKIDDDTDTN